MKSHLVMLAAALSLVAGEALAKPRPDVWNTGKGRWHAAVKDKDCPNGVCWEYQGTYKTRKAARKAAKKVIAENAASGVWSGDGRTDGGLCSQPGVEC